MDFSQLNRLDAIVAGLSAFIAGGAWYSPATFGNARITGSNLTPKP